MGKIPERSKPRHKNSSCVRGISVHFQGDDTPPSRSGSFMRRINGLKDEVQVGYLPTALKHHCRVVYAILSRACRNIFSAHFREHARIGIESIIQNPNAMPGRPSLCGNSHSFPAKHSTSMPSPGCATLHLANLKAVSPSLISKHVLLNQKRYRYGGRSSKCVLYRKALNRFLLCDYHIRMSLVTSVYSSLVHHIGT
jgi:hypothetical protein